MDDAIAGPFLVFIVGRKQPISTAASSARTSGLHARNDRYPGCASTKAVSVRNYRGGSPGAFVMTYSTDCMSSSEKRACRNA